MRLPLISPAVLPTFSSSLLLFTSCFAAIAVAFLPGTSPGQEQVPAAAQMDADSIAYMKLAPKSPPGPPTPEMLKEANRRKRLVTQPDLPQVYQINEFQATGPRGEIPVRIYRGANTPEAGALPALVYYHGGGWVIGNLDSHDWICRMIANKADRVVISVDYRLAPEFTFPAAYDDALAAIQWVAANANKLRIDPSQLSVGGDSAGGNLAAAVALSLRDEGKIALESQILIYPAVDLSLSGNYYGRFTKDLILTDDAMRMFIGLYVPNAEQRKDWRASPLLAPSLKGLPPALVLLAGFDPLLAEGEAYASRLQKEGVATTVKRFPGQMHGFLSNAKLLPKAYDAIDEIAAMLKGSAAGINGTSWQLVKFTDSEGRTHMPEDKSRYTVEFRAEGRAAMRNHLNRGTSTWETREDGGIELGPLAITRALNPPHPISDRYARDWQVIRRFEIKEGKLVLSLPDKGGSYEFEPMLNSPSKKP